MRNFMMFSDNFAAKKSERFLPRTVRGDGIAPQGAIAAPPRASAKREFLHRLGEVAATHVADGGSDKKMSHTVVRI